LLTVSRSFINVANSVLWMMAIILKANKVNLFVSSVLFVFWYHSPNFLNTPPSLTQPSNKGVCSGLWFLLIYTHSRVVGMCSAYYIETWLQHICVVGGGLMCTEWWYMWRLVLCRLISLYCRVLCVWWCQVVLDYVPMCIDQPRSQSFWLLIMRSRVRFPVLSCRFFLEEEDSHGDIGLGLRPLLVLHIHISPSTSSGQRNCASWVSQPQKSVTLRPQPGGEITKSIRVYLIYNYLTNGLITCNCLCIVTWCLRTTSLYTTRPSTIFYRLLLNWASLRRH
jgi:hypothetical protein